MIDEVTLVKNAKAGDSASFGILFDNYYDKIYRFVYYKVFNKELAEDITSDVFYKALTRLRSFDAEKGLFASWVYRIARNAVIDHYRTSHATETIDDVFDIGIDERTPEILDAIADLKRVGEYLETLNAKQREIIILRVWEEMSYREIAEVVGGTEDAVKMAFSRGIRDLRDKCGPLAIVLLAVSSLPFYELS
jgi:RNA polymerase sigma-70 factor (ECF subfamily)